jgi:hypothetical protein
MSEIRVDKIQAHEGTISFTGITTFSGSGAFGLPGGNTAKRPEVPKEGQVRYINGDVKKGLEYYNGTDWITVGVANGSVPEGTTPIGIFGGGQTPTLVNTIDYIAITSLGNATDFGDLLISRAEISSCSSSTRGVFGGGATPTTVNTIDYITIATTGNATDFGDLSGGKSGLNCFSSSTRGVFGGGRTQFTPTQLWTNTIDYVTIATIGNAQTFGQLSQRRGFGGGCSSSTRGIFGAGISELSGIVNNLDYVTIATLSNSLSFGQLSQTRWTGNGGCSSSTRGVFGGGATPTFVNTIDFITIATTGNATDFGDLTQSRVHTAACSSSTRGVFGGGYTTPTRVNTIDFITIASQGTDASTFGQLSQSRQSLAALSNSHGGLLAS